MVQLHAARLLETEAVRWFADVRSKICRGAKEASVQAAALDRVFESCVRMITDPFHDTIKAALQILENEGPHTKEEMGTLCTAAAVLTSTLEIWGDAAEAMVKVRPHDAPTLVLNYEYLEIARITSVLDVAEISLEMYQDLDADLARILRQLVKDDDMRELVEQDRQSIGANIAAISSQALDWLHDEPEILACMGVESFDQIKERAQALTRRAGQASLESSLKLLNRFPHHRGLARNVIYQARQHRNILQKDIFRKIEEEARDHVSKTWKLSSDQVYSSEWLPGRRPLADEPPFKPSQTNEEKR
jgi:hypothetical protein